MCNRFFKLLILFVAVIFVSHINSAVADLIPPHLAALESRMRENPHIFDRYDQFCADKNVGDACVLSATPLAGGGAGRCRRTVNSSTSTIDLACERIQTPRIARDLPSSGFVADSRLCEMPQTADMLAQSPYPCQSQSATYVDRFCRDKKLGSACIVELFVDDKKTINEGVCQTIKETEPYYLWGYRIATRDTIQCVAATSIVHTFVDVPLSHKLNQ